jgi:hypothetical protein
VANAFQVIRTVRKKDSIRLSDAEVAEICKNPMLSLEMFDFSDGVVIDEEIIFTTMDPNMIHLHIHADDDLSSHPNSHQQPELSTSSPLPESVLSKLTMTSISEPVEKTNLEKILLLQKNTGEVHLELATLEAGEKTRDSLFPHSSAAAAVPVAGRFSMEVTNQKGTQSKGDLASHAIQSPLGDSVADVSSCVFHLAEASVLGSCAAALALGRLRFGLSTDVLMTLSDYVPRDHGSALALLMLAGFRGSANGACLAAQMCDSAGGLSHLLLPSLESLILNRN